MALPPQFRVHSVTVETQTAEGGLGDLYAAPVRVAGFLDYNRQIVRARDGAEVVSEATFLTDLDAVGVFVPDSRVTLPDSTQTYVLSARPRDDGGITGLAHLEVTLR